MYNPYQNERLYLAGPECFYPRGYDLWWAERKLAEWYGFTVVLPTSTKLTLGNQNLQENAKEIFNDLIVQVEKTTTIISDLDCFRGCEPDGGTLFEMGWIFANGGKCYGFTRDMRTMLQKDQKAYFKNGIAFDQNGWSHPYGNLPFCPSLIGSTKLVEGTFEDCLKLFCSDINEARRLKALGQIRKKQNDKVKPDTRKRPLIYLSGPDRYRPDAESYYNTLADQFSRYGYEVTSPLGYKPTQSIINSEDPYDMAIGQFSYNLAMIDYADYFVADLSDFHGLEPNNDTSFECGYAFGKKKKSVALMKDGRIMQERIPGSLINGKYVDMNGNDVENFNYPINLMFSCSMPILEGELPTSITKVVEQLQR